MSLDDAARAGRSDEVFLPTDLQRMLDTVDDVKDSIMSGQVPTADNARSIIEAFGLPSSLLFKMATAYGSDIASQIKEHGGEEEDVVRTGIIDGVLMGIALVLGATAED